MGCDGEGVEHGDPGQTGATSVDVQGGDGATVDDAGAGDRAEGVDSVMTAGERRVVRSRALSTATLDRCQWGQRAAAPSESRGRAGRTWTRGAGGAGGGHSHRETMQHFLGVGPAGGSCAKGVSAVLGALGSGWKHQEETVWDPKTCRPTAASAPGQVHSKGGCHARDHALRSCWTPRGGVRMRCG
eukprot:132652-Rhodomonas_salina.1